MYPTEKSLLTALIATAALALTGAAARAAGAETTKGIAAMTAANANADSPRQERVTFRSGKETLVGNLFLPAGYRAGDRLPALVVTGAWMTVKEQMPARYAAEMARRGFAALAFDFAGWGESEGARRQYEDPARKIEDIRAAVAFLRTRPEVDADHVGGLGICASSGYMAHAAARTPEIKSVALVAPWLHDREVVEATYGGKEGVAKLVAAGKAAEEPYRKTGTQTFVTAASTTDKNAIMFGVPYYTETDRGQIPAWRNQADPAFWEGWLNFDALTAAPRLTQPFLMVHSEAAAIPQGAHRFYAAVTAPKGEVWLDGVIQLEFYDRAEPVRRASDAVAAHFRRTLLGDTEKERITERALAGAREFFAALEALDIPRFLNVWAEDGIQEMPYAPGAFPKRLEGRAAIERQYGGLPAAFSGMRFPLRRLAATDEPGVVLAEFDGSIGLKSGGRYDNRYVGVFTFNADGKLAHYSEYFDPFTLVNGFPGAADAALSDDERIRRAVLGLATAADARDWKAVRALFADAVDFDYTSVAGGKPATVKGDDLVAGWTQGLTHYARTKHHFGDIAVEVNSDSAVARFTGQATHVKADGARWTCGGDYVYRFARTPGGWKAVAAKFDMAWEQGER